MKKYLYLLIALCTLGACSDFLDETPKGTLIPKTVDDFALMMEDNDDYGGYNNTNAGPTIVTMLDDDIKITDSPVKLSRYSQAALRAFRWENNFYARSENDDNYNELYHCIYNCNYILENVETAQEGGAFTRDYVRGAACFHRAFAYFCLVNMYAPHWDEATADEDLGVPLALQANIYDVLDRSTVAEVYVQNGESVSAGTELLRIVGDNNLSLTCLFPYAGSFPDLLPRKETPRCQLYYTPVPII